MVLTVANYLKSDLALKHLQHIHTANHEVIWLSVTLRSGKQIVICAVYRPGSAADSDVRLIEYLDSKIDQARTFGSQIIIAGDFNVHSRQWLNS